MADEKAPPASGATDVRLKLLEALVAYSADQYKEYTRITAVLDDKAQKTAGTAGLFLAAGFALLKPGTANVADFIGAGGLVLVALAVGLFMLVVVLTIAANLVRKIPGPPEAGKVREMTLAVASLNDAELSGERRVNQLSDLTDLWTGTLEGQREINTKKARAVHAAQFLLGLATLITGGALILALNRAILGIK